MLRQLIRRFGPVRSVVGPRTAPKAMLVIGDSISLGFTPFLRTALVDRFDVERPEENCRNSFYCKKNIRAWTKGGQWDIAIFNAGLHDITKTPYTPLKTYIENILTIADQLKSVSKQVLFVETTCIPNIESRYAKFVPKYNYFVNNSFNKNGIKVIKMYDISLNIPETGRISPTNLHYTDLGSAHLASNILEQLGLVE